MRVETDTYVTMRDGIGISVDLHFPDGPGPFPTILSRTPYIKNSPMAGAMAPAALGYPRMSPVGPMAPNSRIMVDPEFLTANGYAVVVGDTRGTGYAEGDYDYYNFTDGPYDGYDTIEWIAAQSWCNGNVGMTGASAGAILAYAAAITNPPHLRAIMANMHPTDFYDDQWFVGGIFRYEDRIAWATGQQLRNGPLDPGDPAHPAFEHKRAVYRKRYDRYYQRIKQGKGPVDLDWLTDLYSRPVYDDSWKRMSLLPRLKEIRVPVLNGGVLFDHFGRGTLRSHEGIDVPKRLYMGPGAVDTEGLSGASGLPDLALRWFDHFLRGVKNGVTEEPSVRMYLTGAEQWVDEPSWPLPTVEQSFHFAGGPGSGAKSLHDGCLGGDPGGAPDAIAHDPANPNITPHDLSDYRPWEERALTYTSDPLTADLRVVGLPHIRLFVQSDATDVDFSVRLTDVYPDGRSRFLNYGGLKASHRGGHERPQPLTPGQPAELDIEVWPVTHVFKAGHRIRVSVSTSDFPNFEVNTLPSKNLVLHDAQHPSRLVLPVAKNEG